VCVLCAVFSNVSLSTGIRTFLVPGGASSAGQMVPKVEILMLRRPGVEVFVKEILEERRAEGAEGFSDEDEEEAAAAAGEQN
jgi:hypothetical protein